jgi:hypothetical protein
MVEFTFRTGSSRKMQGDANGYYRHPKNGEMRNAPQSRRTAEANPGQLILSFNVHFDAVPSRPSRSPSVPPEES